MTEPENTAPKLSLIERINIAASKEAKALADTFDLRDCLHLEANGFEPDEEIELRFPRVRGKDVCLDLDTITEALREFIKERFADKFAERMATNALSGESPEIDVSKLLQG